MNLYGFTIRELFHVWLKVLFYIINKEALNYKVLLVDVE